MPDAPLLIFLHIPKTAGSTLAQIIRRQYGSSNVLMLYDSAFGEELQAHQERTEQQPHVVMGHYYFGLHAYSSRPALYLTMLRDPVKRVISHYSYVRRDPGHYLFPLASRLNLADYIRACGEAEPNNDQTRLLAGRVLLPDDGTWTYAMLPAAKKNLRDCFQVVGITEDFDRSILLTKRVFGWKNPYYVRQNISKGRPTKERIPPETRQVIEDHNELDIELYRFAQGLFREQVRLQGNSLEAELRTFRQRNAAYRLFHRFLDRFPQ